MATTAEQMSWDEIKALVANLAIQSQETERRMQETDRRMKELQRQLGGLGNRLGQFVQDMVQPAVVRLFQERGHPVHRVYPNAVARSDDGQAEMEIDLLVIDGAQAIAVECKSRLTPADVDEHVERLGRFKACFTEHADKELLGAVAAMGASDEAIRYAEAQGLYVLVQADDDVVVRNRPGFEPKRW
jgi:hypothetical protein